VTRELNRNKKRAKKKGAAQSVPNYSIIRFTLDYPFPRAMANNPSKPVPNNQNAAGIGTGEPPNMAVGT
jgi:hypothetical protein